MNLNISLLELEDREASEDPYVIDLGIIDYKPAVELQREIVERKKKGSLKRDFILVCEHKPVITYGRRSNMKNLRVEVETLSKLGIQLHQTDRGGDFTYHGPGMLVVYPIVDLRALKIDCIMYLRFLEDTVIKALSVFQIQSVALPGKTGVWIVSQKALFEDFIKEFEKNSNIKYSLRLSSIADRLNEDRTTIQSQNKALKDDMDSLLQKSVLKKVCSIGIRVSGGVTSHGFCLNVNRLPPFGLNLINPCGFSCDHYAFISDFIEPSKLSGVKEVIVSSILSNFSLVKKGCYQSINQVGCNFSNGGLI